MASRKKCDWCKNPINDNHAFLTVPTARGKQHFHFRDFDDNCLKDLEKSSRDEMVKEHYEREPWRKFL